MTEKSLEEEVAELAEDARCWLAVFVDGRYAPQHEHQAAIYRSYLRLIADWRKRGEQIEELERCLESAIKWWPDDDRENELLDVYRAALSKGKPK